ncbi:MAG: radical SAM protein [Firmicutes bacterium HGW-Firmicutes-21]|nr:MAG: radical SAM protein [Firmicutes bacterium HGW-Firmicutes-21]
MVEIITVRNNSYADRAGIKAGDKLLSVNGKEINDVLDYRFYTTEKILTLIIERNGINTTVSIKKPEYDDIGLEFSSYLMDEKKRCKNNCIFCFIDQNPPGMRESVYFKDDDERLSFLQGNYVTLTNLTDKDIERIIEMRISPVNISVHTVNPVLRVKMMRNKNAGECLKYIKQLDDGGIALNTQLVLCRGINDGAELERSLEYLSSLKNIQSIAAVPCGISGHRDGLYDIKPYEKESAAEVVGIIDRFGERCLCKRDIRLVYAADEFFILSEKAIPPEEYYEDYPQIENGVGMLRSHYEEFLYSLANIDKIGYNSIITIVTGEAAYPHIKMLAQLACNRFPQLRVRVRAIKNNFFGGHITVSGLVVGSDIIEQLKDDEKSDILLIPSNMLRYDRELFLDNTSVYDVEKALSVRVLIVEKDGADLAQKITGQKGSDA